MRKIKAGVLALAILAAPFAGTSVASAEPSPGMARATYHCHWDLIWAGLPASVACHVSLR